jgi:signal transduction histidine kinase
MTYGTGLRGYGRPVYTEPGTPQPRVRPPLTMRLKRRHWIMLDCLAAVPAAVLMLVVIRAVFARALPGIPAFAGFPFVVLIAAAGAVPVALRRLQPLLALGTLLAMSVAVSATGVPSELVVSLPAAYVLYIVAAACQRRVAAVALAATLGTLFTEAYVAWAFRTGGASAVIPVSLIAVICWAFGSMMRQRRAYAGGLQRQAASRAVAEERLRIARELHDVVAHSMSVIAVQAGFGSYVIDEQPAKAREALGAIQATSHDALDEMRRMLSVLRQPEPGPGEAETGHGRPYRLADMAAEPGGCEPVPGGAPSSPSADGGEGAQPRPRAPLRPAPGLADLDRLITRVGHAGVHVDLRVSGNRRTVPAGVDLSAFRIIQEALTNVVKHAATPDCRVTVDYRDEELRLEIIDDGRGCALPVGVSGGGASAAGTVPSGHGLIGMGERAHLCGGQFSAGPLPERGFRVAAVLPLNGDAA